ncbi:MAG: CPBP family intramembrane metalloprotease [Acidimicrobiia bacterium]|nr:CPBP family intramembrane metalloprotease [Acidimicrobiia bacterium]
MTTPSGAGGDDVATDLTELVTSAENWTCQCGRANAAGLSLCPHCGRVPPRGVARNVSVGPTRDVEEYKPKVRAVRLALRVIALGLVFQIVVGGLEATGHMETNKAINVAVWGGFIFYAIVLAVVLPPALVTRPRWVIGNRQTATLLGAEIGFALAALVIALNWALLGQPTADAFNTALVSEATVTRILMAVVYACVAAPVVEELLFRGVVAESLRAQSAKKALWVSAILFALWHWRLTPFYLAYYTVIGLILCGVYFRRGLRASMATHAAFNGSLVLFAILVALGPGHRFESSGVVVQAPGGWHTVTALHSISNADLALEGPGSAGFVVTHSPLPPNVGVDLQRIASAVNDGTLPAPPQTTITAGSARVVTYPAGQAVEFSAVTAGRASEVVLLPSGGRLWEVDVFTAGSTRAKGDYPGMLRSLRLPAEATS